MKQQIARLIRNDEGQDLIEYALIAGLIALGSVATLTLIGGGLAGLYNQINGALTF